VLVPLEQITPNPDNPREVTTDDDAFKELVASIKSLGIIVPLHVVEQNGGYLLLGGHRRYAAAQKLNLTEVPVVEFQRDEPLGAVMVADNVIRADLNPVEEANAYAQLLAQPKATAKTVAKLVGKDVRTVEARLKILALPDNARRLFAESAVPLGALDALVEISTLDAPLAELVGRRIGTDAAAARLFVSSPGSIVEDILTGSAYDPVPVAYRVGAYGGPHIPHQVKQVDQRIEFICTKLGSEYGDKLRTLCAERFDAARLVDPYSGYAYSVWHLFNLDQDARDAARAYGCLLELVVDDQYDQTVEGYATDAEWVYEQLAAQIGEWTPPESHRAKPASSSAGETHAASSAQRKEQAVEDEYEKTAAARKRNLDLGVHLAKWNPKITRDSMQVLATLALEGQGDIGWTAARALMLTTELPVTVTKSTQRERVHYLRGDELGQFCTTTLEGVTRAKTPEQAHAAALRLLAALQLVDKTGLAGVDANGVYRSYQLGQLPAWQRIEKQAMPPSVKKHHAELERQAEERRNPSPATDPAEGAAETP